MPKKRTHLQEKETSLADVLRDESQCGEVSLEGDRLSAVNGNIRCIGNDIPLKVTLAVRNLFLSGNYLSSTIGLEQFKSVTVLSLANNSIRYLEELEILNGLPSLKKLSLAGNSVCSMPYYTEIVIANCVQLVSLDGSRVDSIQRSRAKIISYKAQTVFQQLRVNELRNAVLAHGSKLICCHLELRTVVCGKFRSLLGGHVRGSFDHERDSLTGGLVSRSRIGAILRHALNGGVFRWLQYSSASHFNKLVQDHAYRLVRENKEWSAFTGTSGAGDEKSAGWDTIMSEIIKLQQEYFLQLTEYCEIALTEHEGFQQSLNRSELDNAVDAEVLMDCIGQLQFAQSQVQNGGTIPTDCAASSQNQSGGDLSIIKNYCGVGMSHISAAKSASQSTEKCVTFFDESTPREHTSKPIHSTSDTNHSTTVFSRKELVHDRYVALLDEFSKRSTTSTKRSQREKLSQVQFERKQCGSRTSLSTYLPAQQEEPMEAVIPAKAVADICSNFDTVETRRETSLFTDQTLPRKKRNCLPRSSDIEAFISRAKEQLPQLDDIEYSESKQVVVENILRQYADLNYSIEIFAAENEHYLVESASFSRYTPAVPAGSMRELKQQVGHLNSLYMLRKREIFEEQQLHEALLTAVVQFEEKARSIPEISREMFSDIYEAHGKILNDLEFARELLPKYNQIFDDIKRLKSDLIAARSIEATEQVNFNEVQCAIAAAREYSGRLQSSLTEMALALETTEKEFTDNATIVALSKYRSNSERANMFRLKLLSHKRFVFRWWRLQIRRKRKVGHFSRRASDRRRLEKIAFVVQLWRRVVEIVRRGRRLARWRICRIKNIALSMWKEQLHVQKVLWPQKMQRHRRWYMHRYLMKLLDNVHFQKQYRLQIHRRELYVHLFTAIRVFRGWKKIWMINKLRRSSIFAQLSHRSMQRSFLSFRFCVYSARQQLLGIAQQVAHRAAVICQRRCMRSWRVALNYFTMLQHYQKMRIHFRTMRRRILAQSIARKRLSLLRGRARRKWDVQQLILSFRFWSFHVRLIRLSMKLANRRDKNTLLNKFRVWQMRYERAHDLNTRVGAMLRYIEYNTLSQCFSVWRELFGIQASRAPRRILLAPLPQQSQQQPVHPTTDVESLKHPENCDREEHRLMTTRKSHSRVGKNRRIMPSQLDLQLMFVDDDEDDDNYDDDELGLENFDLETARIPVHATKYCVQLRRYLRRWLFCSHQRKELRTSAVKVAALRERSMQRKLFTHINAKWLRAMRLRAIFLENVITSNRIDDENKRKYDAEHIVGKFRKICAKLQDTSDQLVVATAEVHSKLEEQENTLQDCCSSLMLLATETKNWHKRVQTLRLEIDAIEQLREQNSISPTISNDTGIEPVLTGNVEDNDRVLLLNDVEVQYQKAISAQEDLLRKKERMGIRLSAAQQEIAERSNLIELVDAEILRAATARVEVESLLDECRKNVRDELGVINKRTQEFTAQLDAAEAEKKELEDRNKFLLLEQKRLSSTLENIQRQKKAAEKRKNLLGISLVDESQVSSVAVIATKDADSIDHYNRSNAKMRALKEEMQKHIQFSEHLLCSEINNRHHLSQSASIKQKENLSLNCSNVGETDLHERAPELHNDHALSYQIEQLTMRIKQRFQN